MSVVTIATETVGVVGQTLASRSGGPSAKAMADGPAPVLLRAVVLPLVVGGAPEAEEGRLAPTPSRVHAVPVLGTKEEGSSSSGEVPAVGADGGVAGRRRGVKGLPGRVAPGHAVVALLATGVAQDATAAVVAPEASLRREARGA